MLDKKLLPTTIVDLLKRFGALKIEDLHKRTNKRYKTLSRDDLDSILMKMEIQGIIKVYRLPRGKRRVELV